MSEKKSDYVRCRVILEMLGKPKEHIEKTIKDYIQKIREDGNFLVLKEKFSEPESKDELWAVFSEFEMVVKGIPALIGFCFDYMPSSVLIIKPEEFLLKNIDISNFINDLQAKLHTVDMVAKKLRMENDFLKRNIAKSFENYITTLLKLKSMD